MPAADGGLGNSIVGNKVNIEDRNLIIQELIGEGGFSFVYLVKEIADGAGNSNDQVAAGPRRDSGHGTTAPDGSQLYVMKVTAINSRTQKGIAEKEAKLLARFSHPSIIKMYGACYSVIAQSASSGRRGKESSSAGKEKPQHIILMEYCEGGHSLEVCNRLVAQGKKFERRQLILAFGQICNAVSYLHSQTKPIVHRDLKPANFLVKNNTYKLCDFGSAVLGHVELRTPKERADAEEVIEKTTTQMFRAPEMVDLYMNKKLTQATDVWALGCCLYSLAYLQNCFEEGSNLAILSGKYTIPDDNPYGDDFVELLDRMLKMDCKARADMREVIMCLSALYSGRPLPARLRGKKSSKHESTGDGQDDEDGKDRKKERVGAFRTDGQGVQVPIYDPTKKTESKKLNSNSVAARRKRAAQQNSKPPPGPTPTPRTSAQSNTTATADPIGFGSFHSDFSGDKSGEMSNQKDSFSKSSFGDLKRFEGKVEGDSKDFFGSFDSDQLQPIGANANANSSSNSAHAFDAAFAGRTWGGSGSGSGNDASAEVGAPPQLSVSPTPITELKGEQRALAILRKAEAEQADADSQPIPSIAQSEAVANGVSYYREDRDMRDPNDAQRKDRSRRGRTSGQNNANNSSSRSSVDKRLEGMSLDDGGGDPPEQQLEESWEIVDKDGTGEHRSRRSKAEDEEKRRRSGSRSRRKARGARDGARAPAPEKQEDAPNPRQAKKMQSFRNVFNRKGGSRTAEAS